MEISKLKVLLVEDNELNQKFAVALLNKFGYEYDIAENGLVAVEFFNTKVYDLILMDIQMPEMNGIEATKVIRKLEAEKQLNPTPIIAVTAFAMDHDRRNCMEAGMNEFLTKPYKPSDLEQKIRLILK